jgi:hypothetical protein
MMFAGARGAAAKDDFDGAQDKRCMLQYPCDKIIESIKPFYSAATYNYTPLQPNSHPYPTGTSQPCFADTVSIHHMPHPFASCQPTSFSDNLLCQRPSWLIVIFYLHLPSSPNPPHSQQASFTCRHLLPTSTSFPSVTHHNLMRKFNNHAFLASWATNLTILLSWRQHPKVAGMKKENKLIV